jgi:RNA polymerase sigma-70 factor (ECF subfamily)
MEALLTLPEEQREVLMLVALEGLAYKDAAELLGIPLGTLMSRLGRARAALRAAVGEDRQAPARPASGLRVVR